MTDHNDPRFEQAVRERDNNQCQLCHRRAGEGADLQLYEIVPTEDDEPQMSNYILLCADHRDAAKSREEVLEQTA